MQKRRKGNAYAGRTPPEYAIIIEKTGDGYGAHVPDLPGCIAAGDTLEETEQLIREAIEVHLEGMRLHGDPIPDPSSR